MLCWMGGPSIFWASHRRLPSQHLSCMLWICTLKDPKFKCQGIIHPGARRTVSKVGPEESLIRETNVDDRVVPDAWRDYYLSWSFLKCHLRLGISLPGTFKILKTHLNLHLCTKPPLALNKHLLVRSLCWCVCQGEYNLWVLRKKSVVCFLLRGEFIRWTESQRWRKIERWCVS